MTRWSEGNDFAERLGSVAEATERMLERLLADASLPGEITRPARFMEAMRYASLAGGKRLRPFLVVESARLFGVEGDGVLRVACALEMIHCYSLVHDDLPAMDNDDLRRGRPTTHKAYDEATAILVGDGLLTLAFDVTAASATHPDPNVRIQLVLELARHSGIGGMVGGQILDLEAEAATEPHTAETVIRVQAMKTGALLHYAVLAGALMGGADAEATAAMSRYGKALGAAFQVADDILDVEADSAALGKAAGKDAGRNKATLVAALGLEAARARRDRAGRMRRWPRSTRCPKAPRPTCSGTPPASPSRARVDGRHARGKPVTVPFLSPDAGRAARRRQQSSSVFSPTFFCRSGTTPSPACSSPGTSARSPTSSSTESWSRGPTRARCVGVPASPTTANG